MDRKRKDGGIVSQYGCRAVALVHVAVQDDDTTGAAFGLLRAVSRTLCRRLRELNRTFDLAVLLVDVDMFMVNAMLGIMFPEAWILLDDTAAGGTNVAASSCR